jgi:CBS domain-containing protein
MRVRQIMSKDVIHCGTSTPVANVAALMKQHDIGLVPVVHENTQLLAGVVTDRDLCLQVLAAKASPEHFLVNQCMSVAVTFCKPNDTIESVLQKMASSQVRRLPVLEKGMLAGLITMGEIIRQNAAPQVRIFAALRELHAPKGTSRSKKTAA